MPSRSRSAGETRTTTSPALGELDGVADQVRQHLAQAARVAAQAARETAGTIAARARSLCGGPSRRTCRGSLSTISRRSKSSVLEVQLAGLDLREVEDVVDDGQQRVAAGADRLGELALLIGRARCRAAGSVMPITPFIGVRISWLMLARNSLLARLADSAATLA